jgi:hypothetical protein
MRYGLIVVAALLAVALQGPGVALGEQNEVAATKTTSVPFNIGLVPYVDVNSHFLRPRNNFSLDGIVGIAWKMDGAALSGVSGFVQDAARGLQLTGVSGYVGGDFAGAQIGGVLSATRGAVTGFQLAGVVNYAGQLEGAQIGLINIGGKVKGLQFGLINVAEEVDGAALGLVNVVRKNGRQEIDFWTGDTAAFSVGTKLGTKYLYSILGVGLQRMNGKTSWMPTLGLGGSIPIHERVFLNIEVLASVVNVGAEFDKDSILSQLRLAAGYRVNDKLALFAGPVLNVFRSWSGKRLSDISYTGAQATFTPSGAPVDLGLGFVVGLQTL